MNQRIVAELRDWNETTGKDGRPAYQGRVFNDIRHLYPDDTFITIEAHDVQDNKNGRLVTHVEGQIYVLWDAHKRKDVRKDLFNED